MDDSHPTDVAACKHVPTFGKRWLQCEKCGARLSQNYHDKSPEAQAWLAEARRRFYKGFNPGTTSSTS
jgi:hypothetical protein